MTAPSSCQLELRIDSDPRWLCAVRGSIDAILARQGIDEGVRGLVMLAVDEAVTNVMRHGYGGRTDQPIWIRFRLLDDNSKSFLIIVDDEAPQVDPATICGRELEDIRPGGLGVHIIRQVMDEVCYSARPDKGMRLTMVKRFGSVSEPQATAKASST
jgi:anti-sigma regulatory factor (Ser/Thr protein kinase)